MVTSYFTDLQNELIDLESELLKFGINEQFNNANQIRIKSYKLFVHATLENYFESIAFDLLDNAVAEWTSTKRVNHVLMNLITYSPIPYSGNKNMDIENRIGSITSEFKGKIRTNNGIREENICRLLIPLGFKHMDFDTTWLATLDSYGSSRGLIAHKPISVQRALEVRDEQQKVKIIVTGLNDIEVKYADIMANVNHPFLITR